MPEKAAASRKYAAEHIPAGSAEPPEGLVGFALRFERFGWDMGGMLVLSLGALTFIGLAGWTTGALVTPWAELLRTWFGAGSFILALVAIWIGVLLLRWHGGQGVSVRWGRVFALEAAGFAWLALLAFISGNDLGRAEAGMDGGLIGWALAELFSMLLSPWITAVLLVVLILFGVLVGVGAWQAFGQAVNRLLANAANPQTELNPFEPLAAALAEQEQQAAAPGKDNGKRKSPFGRLPSEFRKNFRVAEQAEPPAPLRPRDERLPPFEMLIDEKANRPDERQINLTAGLIEKTLADFGIPAQVIGFQVGPTVTQYAVEPGYLEKAVSKEEEAVRQKVRVAQIASLERDLALALSASRLRIEAPVPGRAYIGIEVPNSRSAVVRLRPILESEAFQKLTTPLAIALGRDVSGKPVVADLARMPHMLIAGTTGSGKSVCIAALTTCLVMNNTPEDLRLVMVDPKMVELVRFNGLPHLYGKVETDVQRIMGVLQWTVAEMDRRYKLLEESRSRHIESHNRKMSRRKGAEVLPHIVLLIDELADLMMAAPEQTEPALVRLAQLARATGIHLVVATQRPSTDVVTGLIKANFPARLSFAVASSVDSRVILDVQGAEALLGKGDMLFLPPDAPAPMRAQGVIVTDQEVEKVITYWQNQAAGQPAVDPPWEDLLEQTEAMADRDGLVQQAIAVVRQTQRASTSLLQRRLKIGYPRAARLMDELEDLGVVGAGQGGGKEREVLLPPEGQDETE